MLNFSQALDALKSDARMTREGWNGKNMFIQIQRPDAHSANTLPYLYMCQIGEDNNVRFRVPWLASQTDILADDWTTSPFQGQQF